jgi:hypothetical protein
LGADHNHRSRQGQARRRFFCPHVENSPLLRQKLTKRPEW